LCSVDAAARPALLRTVGERIDADQQMRLFKSSPFEKLAWLIVDEYGTETSWRYWKEAFPQWSHRHSDPDLNELVDRLLNIERPRAAFHAAHLDWPRLATSRLKRLLTDVATVGVEAQGTYRLDRHQQAVEAQMMKQLFTSVTAKARPGSRSRSTTGRARDYGVNSL
jgi:hypothetical protein